MAFDSFFSAVVSFYPLSGAAQKNAKTACADVARFVALCTGGFFHYSVRGMCGFADGILCRSAQNKKAWRCNSPHSTLVKRLSVLI